MPRRHLTDAWVATLRVSIPITSTAASLTAAQAAVAGIALSDGATVDVVAARFGRMAVAGQASGGVDQPAASQAAPFTVAAPQSGEETAATNSEPDVTPTGAVVAITSGAADRRDDLTPDSSTLTFPELPVAFNRRLVPRQQ